MGALIAGFLGGLGNEYANTKTADTQHKRALSDEEHEQALNDHNNTIASLQNKMAQVGPDHPDYAGYQNQLNQAVTDRTALFHPDQPGGAERLGKLIWAKLHGQDPQAPTTTETTAATPGATLPAAPGTMGASGPTLPATPGVTITRPAYTPAEMATRNQQDLANGAPAPPANPSIQFRNQLKAALPNMSNEDLDNAVQIHAGIAAKPVAPKDEVWTSRGQPFQDPESGDWMQPQFNKSGEPRNQPLPGFAQATKQSQANAAVQRREYAQAQYGDPNHPLTFSDEQNMIKLVKQAGTATSSGGHFSPIADRNGDVHAVWMPTSSSKNFGGVQPGQGGSATPSKAPRTMVNSKAPGLVESGNIPIDGRPLVQNANGSHSSELSLSMEDDQGHEVLVPTIVNGKFLTPDGKMPPGPVPKDWDKASPAWKALRDAAWKNYENTGQHLGKFDSPEHANAYANDLHNRPATPKTPAAAKKAVADAGGPNASINKKMIDVQAESDPKLATTASPGALIGGKNTGAQTDALKKAQDASKGYLDVVQAGNGDPSGHKVDPVGSQQIVLAWLRGRVNRVTATEIAAVNNLGGIEMKMEGNYAKIVKGTMTPQQYQWFLKSAKDNAETAKQVADTARGKTPTTAAPPANAPAFDWNAHPVVK